MKLSNYVILFVFFILAACNDKKTNLISTDLLTYGLPMKILAPEGAVVEFDDMGILKEMTIKGGENYHVQIVSSETDLLDDKKVIEQLKKDVEGSSFFSKFVKETPTGFIFEKVVSEDYINYDFRFVKIRGDRMYTYRTGLGQQYTLEAVEQMFEAVQ
jgi:hypothetical protein